MRAEADRVQHRRPLIAASGRSHGPASTAGTIHTSAARDKGRSAPRGIGPPRSGRSSTRHTRRRVTPVLRCRRQVDQGLDRPLHAQDGVGQAEQRIDPDARTVMEASLKSGQYGQNSTRAALSKKPTLTALVVISSVPTAHMITPGPLCRPRNSKTPAGSTSQPRTEAKRQTERPPAI
jgi:hypothetical protein